MGNKCCKSQSSAYSSANATIRSFSSYNSSVGVRSGGSHAITFETTSRGDSLTTLAMKSTNTSDVGKDYRGGSSSTIGQEDPIPVFLRRLNDLNVRVGTRTRFLIELDDPSGVQVRWYHNNLETDSDSDRYQYIHEGGFYCLDIVPVTLEDEGLWVCTAENYAGKSSTAAHLSLIVPKAFKKPFFAEQLRAVLTQCGIVSLECKVIGVPTPKLRWYKDDKEIKAGDIFALTANSSEDCLGVYTCEATNVMGKALSTSKIQVTNMRFDGGTCDADSLVPRGPPPKFVSGLKDASGKVGSVLLLQCQVEVPPWPKAVGWYNDKGVVTDGTLYRLIADGLGMYGVEIKSLRADHNTAWKCVATSTSGAKAVTSCSVTVSHPKNYRAPRFLESLRAVMTEEGLVSFECKVIGYPAPQLCWFKDGKQLQPGDVYELTGSKSLGSYCCVAQNCMGEASSVAELTIEDIQNQLNESEKLQLTSNTQPPRFLVGLRSTEANINESFVFMIKVLTESTPSINWYKEDEQIEESNRYRFSSEENGTFILNVVPLEIDDQAEWKCVAINKYGQTVTSSFLKLNVPKNFKPPRFLDELRIAFSNEGSVNLECKVIGVPQPQLKWFKDGQELNPGDMHKIISGQSGTCCLGTYTCQAHNCMGTVSSSATLLTMEDKSTVKSTDEYLSVDNPLVRNESLSTILEERTSQMEKSYTIEEPADVSFSFDGKEVTVSLYETPDLTHDEALQIIEMYADELSEHISEDNVIDLPSLRIVKQSSISGPVMMEALVIDVPVGFCQQQIVSDTEFDGVSLSEDATLANNDKSDAELCENSLEYYSDRLSSSNSKRDVFYSASETTPRNSSSMLKPLSDDDDDDDGHQPSFRTPKIFMSDSDDQVLTQLNADGKTSRNVAAGRFARSESNNTEEEVSETLAEVENEYSALPHNYCAAEILAQSDEDGLYATVLNKIRHGGMDSAVALSTEEDNVFNIISRPNVDEFLKYMKIILEGTVIKMHAHEGFRNFTDTPTELERSIQALHSLAWKFVEETERDNATVLDKHTVDNVSSLMTAINASLLALEQIDDPFGVSDNVLNEIQSSVCFDLKTLNDKELSAAEILHRLSDQIKDFTAVVNRQVDLVTEQRVAVVLRNTIGTTLVYVKTLQQNISKIKCINVDSLAPLFAMVQPLETIVQDITAMEEEAASTDDTYKRGAVKLKQMLIPPISSIAFHLDNLNAMLRDENPEDDHDLNDIYDRINNSAAQFMALASHGTTECNNLAECFVSFTKPINDLCCYLRRTGRSTENIVSSDYGSDDKLLMDFETLFDELMMDIDTLINNVNVVRDSENNVNPLDSLLEPLQDMKIGLFQVNQVLLSNQSGSNMSYEVVSCFEHLSQQLVQLNNCIVNQSIVEETDKEMPFESSIKMMQKILFDDAIDDLGVNGILFGSVMKPLLQLQNLIVSKMASVESDLSFSEYTDASGSACGTRSLSLSLSNNAQTVLDKADNPRQTKTEEIKTEEETAEENGNLNNAFNIQDTSKESELVESNNAKQHDLSVKRGFECDIGAAFRDEEPNIIMPEDDRENTGFEVLFDETDFVEDEYLDDVVRCLLEKATTDSFMDEENVDRANNDIIPKHVLESFEGSSQQDPTIVNYSSTDLFDELQETLKNISEGSMSDNVNQLNSKSGDVLDEPLEVDKMKNSIVLTSDHELIENETTRTVNTGVDRNNGVISKPDDLAFVEIENSSIPDDNMSLKTAQNDRTSGDSDKSISNDNTVTNNVISEIQTEETDNVSDLDTKINVLCNSFGSVQREELVFKKENISDESCNIGMEITSSDFKNPNEASDSVALDNLNTSELIDYSDNSFSENCSQSEKSFEKANVVYTDVTDANQVIYSSLDSTVVDTKLSADSNNSITNENLCILTSHEEETSTVVVDKDDLRKSCSQTEVVIVTEGSDVSAMEKMSIDVDVFDQPISQTSDENQVFTGIDKQSISNAEHTEMEELNKLSSTMAMPVIESIVDETKEIDSAVVVVCDEMLSYSIVTEVPNETEQSTPLSVNNDNKRVDKVAEEEVVEQDKKLALRADIDSITILTDDSIEKPKEFNEKSYDRVEINEEDKISREENDSQSAVDKTLLRADIENVSESSTITNQNIERKSLIGIEVNAVDGLNDSYQNVSSMDENAQTAILEECVLDGSKHMMLDTKHDEENRDEFNVEESEILVVDSEVLNEQLKHKKDDLHQNIVANNEPAMNIDDYEKPIEKNISLNNDSAEKDVGVKLEIVTDILINRQNQEEKKTSENLKKESSAANINNEIDECVKSLDETVDELKRATVLEHNGVVGTDVCDVVETMQCENPDRVQMPLIIPEENNALINVEVVTADSTQLMDTHEFDENQVEIKYEGDESRKTATAYEEKIILDGENSKAEEKVKIRSAVEEHISSEADDMKADTIWPADDCPNVISSVEQDVTLMCDQVISVESVGDVEKADGVKNVEAKQRVSEYQEPIVLENVELEGEKKVEGHCVCDDDEEKTRSELTIPVNDNLTCVEDKKDECVSKENSEIQSSKCSEENEIETNDLQRLESDGETSKSELLSDVNVGIHKADECEKTPTEVETIKSKTETGNDMSKVITHCSVINYLPCSEHDHIEDFDKVENVSGDHKCSLSIEENAAVNSIEVVTADFASVMSLTDIRFENSEVNYANEQKPVAECRTVVVLENVDELNESNSNGDGFKTVDDEPIGQTRRVTIEESEAIVNEEVVIADSIRSLESCDAKLETVNEKFTESLVDGIEVTEFNVLRSSAVGDGASNTEEAATAVDHVPQSTAEGNKFSKLSTEKSDMTVNAIDKADIHAIPNESDVSETKLLCGEKVVEKRVEIEEQKEVQIEKFESETTTSEVKANNRIDVSSLEKTASVQNDVVSEEKIAEFSVKENTKLSAVVKPKLHHVEIVAANQTECIMLENTNVLTRDESDDVKKIIERASVGHELNIAAIGNMVIDYDTLKENVDINEENCAENATLASVIDERSNEILSKNVQVFKARDKDFTADNEDSVIVTNDSDAANEVSVRITRFAEDDSVEKLSDELIEEVVVIEALKDSPNKAKELFEPTDTSSDIVSPLDDREQIIVSTKHEIENVVAREITKHERNENTNGKSDLQKESNSEEKTTSDISAESISVNENKADEYPETVEIKLETEIAEENNKNTLKLLETDEDIESQKIHKLDANEIKSPLDIVDISNESTQTMKSTFDEIKNDVVCEVTNDERIEDTDGKSDLQKKLNPSKKISSDVSAESISVNDNKVEENPEKLETEIEEDNNKNTPESSRDYEMENLKNNKLNDDNSKTLVENLDLSEKPGQSKEPMLNQIKNDVVCKVTNDEWTENMKEKADIRKKPSPKKEKSLNNSKSTIEIENKVDEETKIIKKLETKLETEIVEENNKSIPKSLQNEEIENQKINKLDGDEMKSSSVVVDISDERAQNKKSTLDKIKNDVVGEVIKEEGVNGKSDVKKKSSLKKKKSSIVPENTAEIGNKVTEEKVEKLETKLEKEIGEENSQSTPKSLGNDKMENQTMNKLDVDEMNSKTKEMIVSEVENVECEVPKAERIEEDTNVKGKIKNKSSPKTKKSPNTTESTIEMENTVSEKLERKSETENDNSIAKSLRDDEIGSVKQTEVDDEEASIKEVGKERKKRGSKTKRTKGEICPSSDKSTKSNDEIEEDADVVVEITGESSEENRIDIDTPKMIVKTENDERTMDGNRETFDDDNVEIAGEEGRTVQKSTKSKSRDKYRSLPEKRMETDGKPAAGEIIDESGSVWRGDKGESDRIESADSEGCCPSGDAKRKRSVDVTGVRKRDDRTRQLDFGGGKRREVTSAQEERVGGANRLKTAPSYSGGRYLDVTNAYGGSRSLTPEPNGGGWTSGGRYARSSEREVADYGCCGARSFDSSRLSTRYLSPTRSVYRCPSETAIRPMSYRYRSGDLDVPILRYDGSRGRGGSDSFLHDLRDGPYCFSRRLSEATRRSTYTVEADLHRTKETFRRLYFCVRLIDQTVSSGTRVKFWCSVIGYPEPCVQWYRDGQKLNNFSYNSSTRYATKYADGLAQFIVDNAQSCDSGEYTCVAFNSRDRISTTGFLTVYTSPSMFAAPERPVESSSAPRGDSLYAWNGDDFRHGGGNKSLTGHYCRRGWQTSDDAAASRCSPKYPKFVTGIIADDVATYGGTIAFHVRVQGSPLPNVTWMRESKPLPRFSAKYVYLDEGGLYTLLVKDSTARDGGTYVCRACNLYGSADAKKSVRVVSLQDFSEHRGVKPAIIVSRPNDRLNVAVGEDITVTLRVAGEPKPKVIWMRGARDVTFLDRSLKETVNDYVVLSIKKAQLSDAGTYFIIAKNVYGSDRAFVTVGVRKRARSLTPPRIRNTIDRRRLWPKRCFGGCAADRENDGDYGAGEVPGPIRSEPTVSDRANNRISLTWDKPEKAENALVYMVETRSSADEEECWKQVGMTLSNFIDVYNLKPGNRYKFRVTARNRFGWGRPVATADYVDVSEPKYLPEFRQPLPGVTKVLSRHTATLQCHVGGFPKPRVTWYKDGEPLALINGKHVIACTETGRCTLTIADAAEEDAGRYACEAINDQGRACTLTVVEVMANRRVVEAERRLQGCLMKNNDFKESAPIFTKRLTDRTVEINSTVRLSCQVNGLPAPSITWYKDGRPIDPETATADGQTCSRDSDNFSTLELTGVRYDDSGAYTAFASNPIGTATTRCVLEVINRNRTDPAIPEFVFDLPPVHEAVDSIILNAQVDAYRPVKVEWSRDGIQLRNGRRVDIITDRDGKLELRIAGVTKRDSGTYALRVSNDTGSIESRCEVDVVERKSYDDDIGTKQIPSMTDLYSRKPKFVVKPKFQEVEEGERVIIDSEIVGDPLPDITWLRDGLKTKYYRDNSEFSCVANGNRYQLIIAHAKLTHTGTYTLLAANPHGQIKALISLQVYSTGNCKRKMENGTNHSTATVEWLPRIYSELTDIECCENDTVVFECKLNITQETDVRWTKDGKLVRLGNGIVSELANGDIARLEISKVKPAHEGLYTCTAYNDLGQDSTSARLQILSDSRETKTTSLNGLQRKDVMHSSPTLAGESVERSPSVRRLKRSSAPKFYAVLHDRMADVGETVRFQCSVSGHPPPWSSWEKDGVPVGVNGRMRIREDEDHRSMEICDITAEDAGLYRITVENKYGRIQATARLEVLARHRHLQTTINGVQITDESSTNGRGRQSAGSTAHTSEKFTLNCDIRGNSMSDVTWYKDDEKVETDDGRVSSDWDDVTARLSISNLESADTGVYTCIARCESGITKCSTELCVFDTKSTKDSSYLRPPIFVQGLVPRRVVVEGERVQMSVKLQGAVPMSATWFRDGVPLPDCKDFRYASGDGDGAYVLSIADPFVVDSGVYSCKVTNKFGEAVSTGQLVVNEITAEFQDDDVDARNRSPAIILWGPCDTTALRDALVVLEMSYAGNPEPRVQWCRAGKTLESDGHLCITNADGISNLTINSITADDGGKYIVRVDNGLGNDYHFASVAVEGPPDPPSGRPAVSVSETSADVTWSGPAYDGGCVVTGYSVEVRPFNQCDWKLVADKCHSLSHIVRGLTAGESYVFRVRAENMHGSSEPSAESVPVYILQTDYGNTVEPKNVTIENGQLFTERYEVLDELGKGRYGIVHKVKELETGQYFAAKFVRCIKSKDREKAQEEVDVMNRLRHPKLLQLIAAFENPKEVVMVTEYISGGELFERVVADDFTLTEKDCILFTRQLCEGVEYMHKQNVMHLDLKPENIMCQSRTSHQIKIIDFGLAEIFEPGKRVLFGTPEFVPPEIISYEPIGLESDMWSVGVICYVLLSGRSPFMGDNDAETFANITRAEFDFDDDAFDAVSQDSKDFISALLIKRKEKRLTARECLRHKWLAQQDMDVSYVILSTDKLKKFIIRRKWQKTGNAIRALGRMATLSAASRRGGAGGTGGVGGGGGGGNGNGNSCSYQQQFKMASVSEEESAGESSAVVAAAAAAAAATKRGGRRSCDARSDSGFSDCSSLTSSSVASAQARSQPHHCNDGKSPSAVAIAEETIDSGAAAAVPVPVSSARSVHPTPLHAAGITAQGHVSAGTRGGGSRVLCETNRMIFERGAGRPPDRRDGVGGLRRVGKEPVRVQTAAGDNFKKAFAFWKK